MIITKQSWILFFLIHSYILSFSQTPVESPSHSEKSISIGIGKISGRVIDSTANDPVAYATVVLKDSIGKDIDGTVCDEKGKFSINNIRKGKYRLAISFMGYKEIEKSFEINEQEEAVNLGTILFASDAQAMKEVVIEGKKQLVEEKVDRTIYNADQDATTKGGDATDVLRRVPMLSVDLDGNVSLRGSQNIRVLINNKPSTITANSVADALRQIPADEIKTVEVITSPSSKYEAEGSGGIINIITKKSNIKGLSLNINSSVGLRASMLGLTGNYRKGKLGLSLGGFGRTRYNVHGETENSQLTKNMDGTVTQTLQEAELRSRAIFARYTFGADYDLNKRNSLSASVQFGLRNMRNSQDNLFTQTFHQNILDTSSLRNVDVADLSNNVDVSMNFLRLYEKPQREFSISTLYSRNNRTNDFLNNILDPADNSTLSRLKNQNQSFNQEMTLQADYQTPLSEKLMMEVGGKNIIRKVISEYQYFNAFGSNGEFTQLSSGSLTNKFSYDQNVSAAYLSYTVALPKSYTLKAGGRYEYTTINADFQEGQTIKIPSYGVLVPSINVSKKFENGKMIKAAFNRRIQRPSLQFLNPNIQASNPLNITIGNPSLSPEYTNNYEVSHSLNINKTNINLSAFMRNTRGSIQAVRDVRGSDTIRTTYQNIGKEDAYGLNIFANVNVSNKFTLNGSTDVYYMVLSNNVPDPLYNSSNQGFVLSCRLTGTYEFNKGWGLQIFTHYKGREVQLQGTQGVFGTYSLSLKKDIKNKKGSIGFGAENFFHTNGMRMKSELDTPVITQRGVNTLYNTSFKVNFTYKIGKMSIDNGSKPKRKKVSNDDQKEGEPKE